MLVPYYIAENREELIELIEDENKNIEHHLSMFEHKSSKGQYDEYAQGCLNSLTVSMAKKMIYENHLHNSAKRNPPSK